MQTISRRPNIKKSPQVALQSTNQHFNKVAFSPAEKPNFDPSEDKIVSFTDLESRKSNAESENEGNFNGLLGFLIKNN